jgi:hypothetical protein
MMNYFGQKKSKFRFAVRPNFGSPAGRVFGFVTMAGWLRQRD